MKKVFAILLFFLATNTYAQDTSKVEQYCEVVATRRVLSSKVTVDIDYGEERSLWKDNRVKDEEGNIKKFNSVIDALNDLGKLGWKLVNAFPISTENSPKIYHYVFKKEFTKKETEQ